MTTASATQLASILEGIETARKDNRRDRGASAVLLCFYAGAAAAAAALSFPAVAGIGTVLGLFKLDDIVQRTMSDRSLRKAAAELREDPSVESLKKRHFGLMKQSDKLIKWSFGLFAAGIALALLPPAVGQPRPSCPC